MTIENIFNILLEARNYMSTNLEQYYQTKLGSAYLGDALQIMKAIPSNSVNLIMTSPPFALVSKKEYSNEDSENYVQWFIPFAKEFKRILSEDGSLVIHIGGSWVKGKPVKSTYVFKLLIELCKRNFFHLAQDTYWYNRAKLPSPAQWVNVERCRLKDSVDHIWWLSKTPRPKADNRKVLNEYSVHMKKLLLDANYYKPNSKRPSSYLITNKFHKDNKGSIPPNFFTFSNTNSNDKYMQYCRSNKIAPHPARYPVEIPSFFIKFLTDEYDLILDPFGGSNTTGLAAENLNRRWVTIEINKKYLDASKSRFDKLI